MSANSSSSLETLLPPSVFFISEGFYCFISRPSSFSFVAFYIAHFVLLLPLSILILLSALNEWKRRHAAGSASSLSHFDCFTYHIVAMETFCVFRLVPFCLGVYTENPTDVFVGGLLSSFIWYGETSFHVLTCVERYLAVVHPVTYLSLRNDRGTRIRNVCISCVWLLCVVRLSLFVLKDVFLIMDFCLLLISLVIMSACSLAVLRVLVRPGPGEQGGERVSQLKRRAFYTIVTILGVLVLRFSGSLIWTAFFMSNKQSNCLIMACVAWFNVPSSLVLPLMFLHRSGKFMCCKNNF